MWAAIKRRIARWLSRIPGLKPRGPGKEGWFG
jgi:hypothetical protein